MSRKQYSKELKLKLVKKHLEDGISYWKLGKEYDKLGGDNNNSYNNDLYSYKNFFA